MSGAIQSPKDRNYSDRRHWVAFVFVPGLYLCLFLSAVVSLGIACLIIWLLSLLIAVSDRVPLEAFVMIALVGSGGIYGAAAAVYGGWKAIKKATIPSCSVLIRPGQYQTFRTMLTDLCQSMGAQVPENILVEFGISFFVTEANISCFSGRVQGRTLCVSAPLLRILDAEELRAVLAHELAHFTGLDTQYSARFYPVYRGTQSALQEIYRLQESGSRYLGYMLLPQLLSVFILERYLSFFTGIERKISRERETRADTVAASLAGNQALGSALKKVYGYGNLWSQVAEKSLLNSLNEGWMYRNFLASFLEYAYQHPELVEALVNDSTYTPFHPTDSHPQLGSRLSALGVPREFKPCDAPEPISVGFEDDIADVEEQLTRLETDVLQRLVVRGQQA
jgi:Zn-dependent protease with chaperone function